MKCKCGFARKGKFKAGTTEFVCPQCGAIIPVESTGKANKVVSVNEDGSTNEDEDDEPVERGICINDEEGFRVHIGRESAGGYWLKIEKRPMIYPANYKQMLNWIKGEKSNLEVKAELSKKAVVTLDKLIEIEDRIEKTIVKCAEEIKAKIPVIEVKRKRERKDD